MKEVIVLRGLPGAGKSTLANQLIAEASVEGRTVSIFSADKFFVGPNGIYRFDRTQLGAAHGRCLRHYARKLSWLETASAGPQTIIVDNTNTTVSEILPYVKLAQAFSLSFEVVTISCDPALAAARNIHGVPGAKVQEMHKRLRDAGVRIPREWPHRVLQAVIDPGV